MESVKEKTLSMTSKIIRFDKIQDTTMAIQNDYDEILLEFKTYFGSFAQVLGNKEKLTFKSIYYKLVKEKEPY